MSNVDHPAHYTRGSIEAIDAIRAALGKDSFEDYCVANALKYCWRWRHKGGFEDLEKAVFYLNRALKEASDG